MSFAPPPILFPDVELLLVAPFTGLLRNALADRDEPYAQNIHFGNTVPKQRKPRMVIVRRDGGRASGAVDDARVSLRIWGPEGDEQGTSDLARLVLALCWALPTMTGDHPLKRFTHESGPTPIPDESKQPLRYIVGTFRTKGTQL